VLRSLAAGLAAAVVLAPASLALAHAGSAPWHDRSHAATPGLVAVLLAAALAAMAARGLRHHARLACRAGGAVVAGALLLTLLVAGPHLVHHAFSSNQPEACDLFQFAWYGLAIAVATFTLERRSTSREMPVRSVERRRRPALAIARGRAPPR
jgi:hypothetical protein